MAGKRRTDWESIETDYRLGALTGEQIAAKYGVARETIVRHMRKRGIGRDLSDQIAAAASAELLRRKVTERHNKVTDSVTVSGVAAADVVEAHQDGLGRLRNIAVGLMGELECAGEVAPKVDRVIEAAQELGLDAKDVEDLGKAITLTGRVTVAQRIADIYGKVVPLERKSHGLDREEGQQGSMFQSLKAMLDLARETE